ncbi:hypothetical protein ACS0TY_023768 [Phlomoides rotata]
MGDCFLEKEHLKEGHSQLLVKLTKDEKVISWAACDNPPSQMPTVWDICSTVRKEKVDFLPGLPGFSLNPVYEDDHLKREWGIFLGFLKKYNRVAVSKPGVYEAYILPPHEDSSIATVLYRGKAPNACPIAGIAASETSSLPRLLTVDASNSNLIEDKIAPTQQCREVDEDSSCDLKVRGSNGFGNSLGPSRSVERNFATAHPSYLKTLGQAHSSWIFGAIAELVDNSRDAKATKLEVDISMVYSITVDKDIPMLSVIDDGHGMHHEDIQRMISFGRGQPKTDDSDHIGKYGIGFKTGAMRLGKDALVLTQTTNSRSIAFLSQLLNEGNDNLEIPIVSYRRIGQYMEVDKNVQNEDAAKYYLKIIKTHSPFDKYLIGEKVGLFGVNGTGTQIYIWNLDKWGTSYSLEWKYGMSGGSSFHQGGIYISSRRIRSRPGQISKVVPLDYSLKPYLEVIFLDPRMKIYVQGSLVKSRPLAKSLNKTSVENGEILKKPVQLTLGFSQLEWEQANCGIFLYWHGRLIEAYKRVGSMIHNGDCGRGIIGVIDVTKLMDDDDGHVWVHNNKQGFQDCEAYAKLEEWLGERVDEYIDKYVDKIQLRKGNAQYKPDHEWVQCNKCRKWRKMSSDFDSKTLPDEWFCYMKPFNGRCEVPEEVESGLITISTKHHGGHTKDSTKSSNGVPEKAATKSQGTGIVTSSESEDDEEDDDDDDDDEEEALPPFKRPRASLERRCKKSWRVF